MLIAGGGIAGLEFLLGLRHLAGDRVALELLAPRPEFVCVPDAVGEPFGLHLALHRELLRDVNRGSPRVDLDLGAPGSLVQGRLEPPSLSGWRRAHRRHTRLETVTESLMRSDG